MSKPKKDSLASENKGFTIVELLVATAVFGVILLVVTTAILQFTRVYYKGVTESKTQATARAVVDRIAQSIQFNSQKVMESPLPRQVGVKRSFCIGDEQYTYVVGRQIYDGAVNSDQIHHALIVRDMPGCQATSPQPIMSALDTETELLAPKMRLADLQVSQVGSSNLYRVHVRVVYGDRDLLKNPEDANAACAVQYSGTQFCAISEITTIVEKRLE